MIKTLVELHSSAELKSIHINTFIRRDYRKIEEKDSRNIY